MSHSMLEAVTPRMQVDDLPPKLPVHLVVATNFIAPHTLSGWFALDRRVEKLTILLSTQMEANRPWPAEWGDLDVRIQRTTTLKRSWGHRLGFRDASFMHFPWDTIFQLRKLKPHVVISAELGARSAMCAVYRMFARRVPLIVWCGLSEHTEKSRGRLRHWIRRVLLKTPDCVLINGDSGQRYLESQGLPAERIQHYSYATIPAMYEAGSDFREADNAHRLVYVGQLIDRKGALPFVTALVEWCRKNPYRTIDFDLFGSGAQQADIEALQIPDNLNLHFHGESDYDAIIKGLCEGGIFAFPTLADEWGLAVNEAMASGLPVLGSVYSQAVDELIEDGHNGWRFRPDHPEELEHAIDQALNMAPAELNEMRVAARERVRPLTPEKTANDVVNAIRKLIPAAELDKLAIEFHELAATRSPSDPS